MTKKFAPTEIRIPQVWAGVASRKKGVTIFMTYPPRSFAMQVVTWNIKRYNLAFGARNCAPNAASITQPSCTAVGNEAMEAARRQGFAMDAN
jgi:hypothetical protein